MKNEEPKLAIVPDAGERERKLTSKVIITSTLNAVQQLSDNLYLRNKCVQLYIFVEFTM